MKTSAVQQINDDCWCGDNRNGHPIGTPDLQHRVLFVMKIVHLIDIATPR